MTTTPPPTRFEPFIAKMAQGSAAGEADFVGRNMSRLEQVIAALMEAQNELAQLQYPARVVRDRHEPGATG